MRRFQIPALIPVIRCNETIMLMNGESGSTPFSNMFHLQQLELVESNQDTRTVNVKQPRDVNEKQWCGVACPPLAGLFFLFSVCIALVHLDTSVGANLNSRGWKPESHNIWHKMSKRNGKVFFFLCSWDVWAPTWTLTWCGCVIRFCIIVMIESNHQSSHRRFIVSSL
jgi:hypothetical protein